MYRAWAFWRRVWYLIGTFVFLSLVSSLIYILFIKQAPTCFDGAQNGMERGVDCGGGCKLICPFDVVQPTVKWARSFRIMDGTYNAVAYIENKNPTEGTKVLKYTFKLVDASGVTITERRGTTFLPPDSEYPVFEGRIQTGARVPVKTFLTFEPVTTWEKFTDNRKLFTINDRALKGVDSQPRLDATLANTSLDDKRDVEIVATIFDKSGNALTASRTIVPLFEGRATKDVTFTWPEPIAKTLKSCEVPTDVMVAIDLSGSMDDDGGTPPEPVTSALRAASAFVGRLKMQDQVGLTTFATHGKLVHTLMNDKTAMSTAITALKIEAPEERGATNAGDAFALATAEFASPRHSLDARKVLVLLTDGKTNVPAPNPEAYALDLAKKAQAAGITIFTIGLGNSVNQDFLAQAASDVKQRYLAADTRSLDAIYRSISFSICEEGPAVIDIVPKIIGDLNDNQLSQ